MKKIKTAVVGLNMGYNHAKAYYNAEEAELRYVVDLDEAKAARVAEELGCAYTTDWTRVLDEVDAVSICTPHHLHAPQTIAAIEAGKHVLLEKPMGLNVEECRRIIELSESKGVTFMMAYVVRLMPALRKLKEALDSGKYGKPISAQCFIQIFLDPMPGSWFSKTSTLGGGVLFSHGCHYIDIFQWLFGESRQVAQFGTRIGTEWMEGEGTSHGIMEFANGTLAHLVCSWGMKAAKPPACIQVHTTEGMFALDTRWWKLEWVDRQGTEVLCDLPAGTSIVPGTNEKYEIDHFLSCIRHGELPETNGRESLKALRTIWTMYASKGTPVE